MQLCCCLISKFIDTSKRYRGCYIHLHGRRHSFALTSTMYMRIVSTQGTVEVQWRARNVPLALPTRRLVYIPAGESRCLVYISTLPPPPRSPIDCHALSRRDGRAADEVSTPLYASTRRPTTPPARLLHVFAEFSIGNESAPIQLALCRFPGLAISNAKI